MGNVLIKNDMVQMDWDAEGYFESKKAGFLAATAIYSTDKGDVVVCFMEKKAFILIDSDTAIPVDRKEIQGAVKGCFEDEAIMEDYVPDNYVELCNGVTTETDIAAHYGLSEEDCQDIEARLEDLSGYWAEIVEEF